MVAIFNRRQKRPPALPQSAPESAPEPAPPPGALDFASRKLIAGWAVPPAGEEHAQVDIGIDGHRFATVRADRHRPDLTGGRTDLGFVLPVDLPRDERPLRIAARIRGAAADLPGSPRTLPPISAVTGVDNPDRYREQTMRFLKWRFEDAAYHGGIFNGHQPLYGFGVMPCEPGWLERYTITHAIMVELAGLAFETLVDVGGAEGYKGAMIRDLFGARVVSADLSPEACRLAERIYGLETAPAVMEALPFADASFDVVLCSESLEHVSQPTRAVAELLRVARRAVVITVPAEPLEQLSVSVQGGEPHAHVNWFDLRAFDHLTPQLHGLRTRPILTTDPAWREAGRGAEAMVLRLPGDEAMRAAARAMIETLIGRDQTLIASGTGFNGMVAVLLKQECARSAAPPPIGRILDFAVPPVVQPPAR